MVLDAAPIAFLALAFLTEPLNPITPKPGPATLRRYAHRVVDGAFGHQSGGRAVVMLEGIEGSIVGDIPKTNIEFKQAGSNSLRRLFICTGQAFPVMSFLFDE